MKPTENCLGVRGNLECVEEGDDVYKFQIWNQLEQ